MKKVIFAVVMSAFAVASADVVKVGYGALANTVRADGDVAVGAEAMKGGGGISESVAIGNKAMSGATNVSATVAIGTMSGEGAKNSSRCVYIGNGEGGGNVFDDTTSINERQIFASKTLDAFSINPTKATNIHDSALWMLNGNMGVGANRIELQPNVEVTNAFRRRILFVSYDKASNIVNFPSGLNGDGVVDSSFLVTNVYYRHYTSSGCDIEDRHISFETEQVLYHQTGTSPNTATWYINLKTRYDGIAQYDYYNQVPVMGEITYSNIVKVAGSNLAPRPSVTPKIYIFGRYPTGFKDDVSVGNMWFYCTTDHYAYGYKKGEDVSSYWPYCIVTSSVYTVTQQTRPSVTHNVVVNDMVSRGSFINTNSWYNFENDIPTVGICNQLIRNFSNGQIWGRLNPYTDPNGEPYVTFDWIDDFGREHYSELVGSHNYYRNTTNMITNYSIRHEGFSRGYFLGTVTLKCENGALLLVTNGVNAGYIHLSPTP